MPTLDPRRLLWRTRFHHAGFQLAIRPDIPMPPPYTDLLETLFANLRITEQPISRRGTVAFQNNTDSGCLGFFAVAFLDPHRRDDSARPIPHFFVYFPGTDSFDPRDGWHLTLLASLQDAYDAVFHVEASCDEDEVRRRLGRVRGTELIRLPDAPPSTAWMDVGHIRFSGARSGWSRVADKLGCATSALGLFLCLFCVSGAIWAGYVCLAAVLGTHRGARLANNAVERTAGSHSLAAAAHRER